MQQRKGALDAEGEKDQGRTRADDPQFAEPYGTCVKHMQDHTSEQDQSGTHLYDQITHSRSVGPLGAPRPDQKYRRDRGQLPVHEQGDQIAREQGANRGSGVDQGRDMLHTVAHVERIDDRKERGNVKNVAENKAEAIDTDQDKCVIKDLRLAEVSVRQGKYLQEPRHG